MPYCIYRHLFQLLKLIYYTTHNAKNNGETVPAKSFDDNKSDEIDDTADEGENDDADDEEDDTICGDNEEWLDADDVEIKKPDDKNDNTIDKEKNTTTRISLPISKRIKPGGKNTPTKYNLDK
jgi:nitric oxide reductase activation protein